MLNFHINDWKIEYFIKLIVSIQLAMWGMIGLNSIGLDIPILREFIGFFYLAFVPGLIILRILKLHKLNDIEFILYTVGLSLATLMFTGLFINILYPFFGIFRPISFVPLTVTISAIILVLCILSYIRDKDFSNSIFINDREILSLPVLFLCLIPFLAIFGTYLMNHHNNNLLLMLMIVIIGLIILSIGFNNFFHEKYYPLVVFIISISLLYHKSLIMMHLWGWDIQVEYYLSSLVMNNSLWDPTIPINVNAMLSIVMIAPIFSNICCMDLVWVFKLVYPFLFSLVPLGLYRIFQQQTNNKIALFSCFFFVSQFMFHDWMLWLARQEIAELFLVLLILLIIDKNMNRTKRSFLSVVFCVSLAVSHYSLSYIFMFGIVVAWAMLGLYENRAVQEIGGNICCKFGKRKEEFACIPNYKMIDKMISSNFVILFVSFVLMWYMYISSSSALNAVIRTGSHIAGSISSELFNQDAAQGLYLILKEPNSNIVSIIYKYVHLLTQFFISVGILALLLRRDGVRFNREYRALSLTSFAICIFTIAVPFFGSALRVERLYQITLIFMAPFCVIGGLIVSNVVTSWADHRNIKNSLKMLAAFFMIFLFFNTGFIAEIAESSSTSISLNSTIDRPCLNDQEFFMTEWLKDKKGNDAKIYSDRTRGVLLLGIFGERHVFKGDEEHGIVTQIPNNAYIYIGYENGKNGKMVIDTMNLNNPSAVVNLKNSTLDNKLHDINKIFDIGDAKVYYQ